MKPYRKIVSIDPSVNRVGWACVANVYQDEDGVWHDEDAEWSWGYWDLSAHSLTFKFKEVVEYIIVYLGGLVQGDVLVLEWPAFFDIERGHIAAMKGYTINLAGICAYIMGFFRLAPIDCHLLTATQWKGSVSKEITRKRFFRHMGIKQIYKIDHNAVDAVMLLLEFCKRKKITFRIVSKVMAPLLGVQE